MDAGGAVVEALEYEAYAAMALVEMRRVCEEAQALSGGLLRRIELSHRTGTVAVGDTSLLLLVSAAHRKPAMAAVAGIVDELKARVPIWKRDVVGRAPPTAQPAQPRVQPTPPTDATAFRIVTGAELDVARARGFYAGSALDERDGFLHMSARDAVLETARRYYGDTPGPLLLLEVDLKHAALASVSLRWDWVASRGCYFPHLYPSSLPLEAVRATHVLRPAAPSIESPLPPFTFPDCLLVR